MVLSTDHISVDNLTRIQLAIADPSGEPISFHYGEGLLCRVVIDQAWWCREYTKVFAMRKVRYARVRYARLQYGKICYGEVNLWGEQHEWIARALDVGANLEGLLHLWSNETCRPDEWQGTHETFRMPDQWTCSIGTNGLAKNSICIILETIFRKMIMPRDKQVAGKCKAMQSCVLWLELKQTSRYQTRYW